MNRNRLCNNDEVGLARVEPVLMTASRNYYSNPIILQTLHKPNA